MIYRNLILLIAMCLSLNACAMGGKSYRPPERKHQDKLFRPCQDFEVSGDPTGKLCNRTCPKKKCKASEFKVIVKDFRDPETFKWFRAGSFIMIDEDQVF